MANSSQSSAVNSYMQVSNSQQKYNKIGSSNSKVSSSFAAISKSTESADTDIQ